MIKTEVKKQAEEMIIKVMQYIREALDTDDDVESLSYELAASFITFGMFNEDELSEDDFIRKLKDINSMIASAYQHMYIEHDQEYRII